MGQTRANRIHFEPRVTATAPQDNTFQEVDKTRFFQVGDTVDVIDVDAAGNISGVLASNLTIASIIPDIAIILSSSVDTTAATGTPMIRNQEIDDAFEALKRLYCKQSDVPGRFDRRENIVDQELNAPIGGQTLFDVGDTNLFKTGDAVDIISDEGLLVSTTVTAVGINADDANNLSTIAVSGVHDTSGLTSPFLKNNTLDNEKATKRLQEIIDEIDRPLKNEFMEVGDALHTVFETDNLFLEGSSQQMIDGRRLRKGTAGTRATHVEGASDAQLTITSLMLGVLGNEIEIEVQSGVGLTVAVTRNYQASSSAILGATQYLIQVNDNTGAATSQEIADAINADAEAQRIVLAQWGGNGTGTVSAFGPTNLASGADNGTGDYAELEQVFENFITGTGFKWISLHMRPDERNRLSSPPEDDEELCIDYTRARDNVDR